MAILKIKDREFFTRFEYKEIKNIEGLYKGRSFIELVNALGKNPSVTDLEILLFASIQDKKLTRNEFTNLLDESFSDPESEFSFQYLIDVFKDTIDESVFLKKLKKQQETNQQKKELKAAKIIK